MNLSQTVSPLRSLIRTAAPTIDVVSLVDVKAHLRVSHSEEDALIAGYVAAAVVHLDGWHGVLGYCLGAQTWRADMDGFPAGEIDIPLGPLLGVVSVEYREEIGAIYATLNAAEYEVDLSRGRILPVNSWPGAGEANSVRVTFRAGHETSDSISPAIKAAVMLLVGHWYENREAVGPAMSELPLAVNALVGATRRRLL